MTANRFARPENFSNRTRTPLLREHFVYRAFDAEGDLLYVGCSKNLPERMKAHKSTGDWHHLMARLKVVGPLNYETARQLEREAIHSERPLYNATTPERVAVSAARDRIINRRMEALVSSGIPWFEAIKEAVDHADSLVRVSGRGPFRANDLTVANALRVDRMDAETYGGAA